MMVYISVNYCYLDRIVWLRYCVCVIEWRILMTSSIFIFYLYNDNLIINPTPRATALLLHIFLYIYHLSHHLVFSVLMKMIRMLSPSIGFYVYRYLYDSCVDYGATMGTSFRCYCGRCPCVWGRLWSCMWPSYRNCMFEVVQDLKFMLWRPLCMIISVCMLGLSCIIRMDY